MKKACLLSFLTKFKTMPSLHAPDSLERFVMFYGSGYIFCHSSFTWQPRPAPIPTWHNKAVYLHEKSLCSRSLSRQLGSGLAMRPDSSMRLSFVDRLVSRTSRPSRNSCRSSTFLRKLQGKLGATESTGFPMTTSPFSTAKYRFC